MEKKEWIAMVLAGGQGSRLGSLTKELAKPAVPFGGQYRIIDFTLSNCHNSGLDTVGILTQYQPLELHAYIGVGSAWDLDRQLGGVFILPPYAREQGAEWYKGTADAVYQNTEFIDYCDPEYVVVLSGDHIYQMDYAAMLDYHKANHAHATIAVIEVPWAEADRFGIMETAPDGRIVEFAEKPRQPKSNLASMGVYIFTWKVLKQYLEYDAVDTASSHDFGKNVIPRLLSKGRRLFAYHFTGYWKDVGTVESFWKANMDLVDETPEVNLSDPNWPLYSVSPSQPPHYLGPQANICRSLISDGCVILGTVENTVLFPGVYVGPGVVIKDSVVMPYARIESGAVVSQAIIEQKTVIPAGVVKAHEGGIMVVGENWQYVEYKPDGARQVSLAG